MNVLIYIQKKRNKQKHTLRTIKIKRKEKKIVGRFLMQQKYKKKLLIIISIQNDRPSSVEKELKKQIGGDMDL